MTQETANLLMKKEEKKAYEDPTAETALKSIQLPVLYLCIPYRGSMKRYIRELRYWIAKAEEDGYLPVSPLMWCPRSSNVKIRRSLSSRKP